MTPSGSPESQQQQTPIPDEVSNASLPQAEQSDKGLIYIAKAEFGVLCAAGFLSFLAFVGTGTGTGWEPQWRQFFDMTNLATTITGVLAILLVSPWILMAAILLLTGEAYPRDLFTMPPERARDFIAKTAPQRFSYVCIWFATLGLPQHNIGALPGAVALAALSSVVCEHFANDTTRITTGFSRGELESIPWIVFVFAYWRIRSSADSRVPAVRVEPKASVMEAACSRCGNPIPTTQGCAVFCDAIEGIAADGRLFFSASGGGEAGDVESRLLEALMYCEDCSNSLFTEKTWRDAKPLRVDMTAADASSPEGKEARSEVIDFSIALRARRVGTTSEQACRDGHELARLSWKHRNAARTNLGGALKNCGEAMRLKSGFAAAFHERGRARKSNGNVKGALKDYTEAIRLMPDFADAFVDRGVAKQSSGNLEEALHDYNEAIRLKPDVAMAFNNRGVAKQSNGDLEGALRDYDESIRLKPDLDLASRNRDLAEKKAKRKKDEVYD